MTRNHDSLEKQWARARLWQERELRQQARIRRRRLKIEFIEAGAKLRSLKQSGSRKASFERDLAELRRLVNALVGEVKALRAAARGR
jgi:hypothetical protein